MTLFVFLACVIVVLTVLAKLLGPGSGIRDWSSGGIVRIVRDDPRRIVWSDWAVVLTRRGSVDKVARRLRLEERVLLGLIPWGSIERPLGDHEDCTAEHHFHDLGRDEETHRARDAYDHVVLLHRSDGQPLRLLDVVSGDLNDAAGALAESLARQIRRVIRRT